MSGYSQTTLEQYVSKGPLSPGFGSFDELKKAFGSIGLEFDQTCGLGSERRVFIRGTAVLWVTLWMNRSWYGDQLKLVFNSMISYLPPPQKVTSAQLRLGTMRLSA